MSLTVNVYWDHPGPYVDVYFVRGNQMIYWERNHDSYYLFRLLGTAVGTTGQYLYEQFTPSTSQVYYLIFLGSGAVQGDYAFVDVCRLSGHVYRGDSSTVVSGATVAASGGYSDVTDSSGYYSFFVPRGGAYTLTVAATGYNSATSRAIPISEDTVLDWHLIPTSFILSGRVMMSGTDMGISYASVTLSPGDRSDEADGDGFYLINQILPGTYTVTASAFGYIDYSATIAVNDDMQVDFNLERSTSVTSPFKLDLFNDCRQDFILQWGDGRTRALLLTLNVDGNPLESSPSVSAFLVPKDNLIDFERSGTGYLYALIGATPGSHVATMRGFTPVVGKQYFLILMGEDRISPAGGTFELKEITDLVGTVVRNGFTRPISLATVSLSPGGYSTQTDSSGYYSMTGVDSGIYTVTVTASGYFDSSAALTLVGESVQNDFVMNPTHFILDGSVLDDRVDIGIGQATIALSPGGVYTETRRDGYYSIEGLSSGTYEVTVFAANYLVFETSVSISSDTPLNVRLTPAPPGDTHEYYLWDGQYHAFGFQWTDEKTCTLTIEAMVEIDDDDAADETRDSVDLFFIDAVNMAKLIEQRSYDCILSPVQVLQGNAILHVYDFSPVPSQIYYLVLDDTNEFSPSVSFVRGWFRIAETYTIRGYVSQYASAGTPIAGATVTIPGVGSATTDAVGYYSISWIPPGLNLVSVSAQGYEFIASPIDLASDGWLNHSLTLVPDAGHSIGGHVFISGTSTSIPNATVTVSPSGASVATDGSGSYTISGLADGVYAISVSSSGYDACSGSVSLSGADSYVDFYLVPVEGAAHSLSGVVHVLGTQTAIPGATITMTPGSHSSISDEYGQYVVGNLPDGVYTVEVSAAGYVTTSEEVTISGANQIRDYDLEEELTEYYVVDGYVLDHDTDKPVAGATVVCDNCSYEADETGYYSMSVTNGTYVIAVSSDDYRPLNVTIVVSGAPVVLDIELSSVDGSVAEASGVSVSTVVILVAVVAAATVATMYVLALWRGRR